MRTFAFVLAAVIIALALAAAADTPAPGTGSEGAQPTAGAKAADAGGAEAAVEAAKPAASDSIDVNAAVAGIFQTSCVRCHGGTTPAAGLDLGSEVFAKALVGVASVERPESMLVDVAHPEASYLLMKVRGDQGIKGKRMPIGGKALDAPGEALLERWVSELATAHADAMAKGDTTAPADPAAGVSKAANAETTGGEGGQSGESAAGTSE